MPERERVGPQHEHGPHDLTREGRTHARRVAQEQVLLEHRGVGGRDERCREIAEAGRDPVHDLTRGDEAFDDPAGLEHALPGMDVEPDRRGPAGDGLDVGDGQVGTGQDHRLGRGRAHGVEMIRGRLVLVAGTPVAQPPMRRSIGAHAARPSRR